MERDLHNCVDDKIALDLNAITTNTTTVGNIIDTAGFESIEFVAVSKAITDGAYAFRIEDGDASNLSDAADVDVSLLLGALTGFIATDDNTTKRVGCISKKRYVRLSIVSTGTTVGTSMLGAVAVLGHPHHQPVSQ